jgi:hypothetical protein
LRETALSITSPYESHGIPFRANHDTHTINRELDSGQRFENAIADDKRAFPVRSRQQ